MTASIIDILTLVNRLAELPEDQAAEIMSEYESMRTMSNAMRAIFKMADIVRNEKAGSL